MIKTLRHQFAAAIGILLMANLMLFLLIFWDTNKIHSYMHRAEFALDEIKVHMDIAIGSYRNILNNTVVLLKDDPIPDTNFDVSINKLNIALDHLEALTRSEVLMEGDEHWRTEEFNELDRALEIKVLLNQIFTSLKKTSSLPESERKQKTLELLSSLLKDEGDGEFMTLIDEAIEGELMEIAVLEEDKNELIKEQKMLIMVVSFFSLLFVVVIGSALFRNIRNPVDTLIAATNRLANGDLDHRVEITQPKEFSHLAASFNLMVSQLEMQHNSLLNAKEDLEIKVEERTKELHKLNHKLRQLDSARKRFLSAFSHELHTPIKIIRSDAKALLAEKSNDSNEPNKALKRIIDVAGQMEGVVHDLLFLARTDDATSKIQTAPLILDELINDLRREIAPLAKANDLLLKLEKNGTDFHMEGDIRRLKQLFTILIDNALRYSKSGDLVTINLMKKEDNIVVSIEDTGIGVDESELVHIFERYFRGQQASRLVPEGAGLGLPLAKAIVDAHRGEISISSSIGIGTQVTVRLPINLGN